MSVDFGLVPAASNEYLVILFDNYTRFPVVEVVQLTSARAIIPCLDKIFSKFGIPHVLKFDNGPPFNSCDFNEFSKYLGFKHRKIAPYWPHANGEVERYMHTIKEVIKAAVMESKRCISFYTTTELLLRHPLKYPQQQHFLAIQ